jgi:hypothetical protein
MSTERYCAGYLAPVQPTPKYSIGTKYRTDGRHWRECEIVEILTTRTSSGDITRISYVCEHEFLGQIVREWDVCETYISRCLHKMNKENRE